jgi:hypothetical protein
LSTITRVLRSGVVYDVPDPQGAKYIKIGYAEAVESDKEYVSQNTKIPPPTKPITPPPPEKKPVKK